MTDYSGAALHFEAVKISMRQDKNGLILQLSMHPDEAPKDIITSHVGTRYMVAMVQLGDDEKPVKGKDKTEGDKAVDIAGALCRNERFQNWLYDRHLTETKGESAAIEAIRDFCEVKSRSEFHTNEKARNRFLTLRDEFEADYRKGLVKK